MSSQIIVGVDPGTRTGAAVAEAGVISEMLTLGIIDAMTFVAEFMASDQGARALVIVEDARKRKWFGKADADVAKYGAGRREGAGAAKRESAIWEEWLWAKSIAHRMEAPIKGGTKLPQAQFAKLTGWDRRCSVHARDAGMIAWHFSRRLPQL